MRVSPNLFAIVAAVVFAIGFCGAVGWLDGLNLEAFVFAGLFFLALSGLVEVVFGARREI